MSSPEPLTAPTLPYEWRHRNQQGNSLLTLKRAHSYTTRDKHTLENSLPN
jgi:hypothetical protein